MNGAQASGANAIHVRGTRVHVLNVPGTAALIDTWLREGPRPTRTFWIYPFRERNCHT